MSVCSRGRSRGQGSGVRLEAERERETRQTSHLHFGVAGESDESGDHSLSHQSLIHPFHQQLIGQASREVTGQGGAWDRASTVSWQHIAERQRERGEEEEEQKRAELLKEKRMQMDQCNEQLAREQRQQ